MNSKSLGIIILLLVVLGGGIYYYLQNSGTNISISGALGRSVKVKGYIGSEKNHFLENPKIQRLLKNRYGLEVDFHKAGSIEMITMERDENTDFLWPSSQVALELFNMNYSGASKKSEIIFNSPIVMYSWDLVADKLISLGYVEQRNGSYYLIKIKELIELIQNGTKWKDIGLDELFGKVSIVSTDPTRSNSGNMFSGLLANLLYDDVVTSESLNQVLPEVVDFFKRLGYLEHSTGILFDQYLQKGVGSYPLIVGYENQIVEFSLQNPEIWPKVEGRMRILYPEPTVWSSHPIIALSENGKKLLSALEDKDIQEIAWSEHGFRTGLGGIQNKPSALGIQGIPENINKVIPMPDPRVMESIIQALNQ